MLLMIDNYDSFTYNLVQYLQSLGAEVKVVRNDALSVARSPTRARAHRHFARPVHARTRPASRWR
jgi:anthranilate synthase component 2